MRNIEIKARIPSIADARDIADSLGHVRLDGRFEQVDTYFHAPSGRLKLREVTGTRSWNELISYERPDAKGPKGSTYTLARVEDAVSLRNVLMRSLRVLVQVRKDRTVFLWNSVRIHLDVVEGLGSFIEFEVVLDNDMTDEAGRAVAEHLLGIFGICEDHLIAGSYSDLLLAQA